MTICVAAISQGSTGQGLMITGASDRMLTAGDIEFEPEQPKIHTLTNSIALMLAGDSAIQREIVHSVHSDVIARIKTEPKNWWKVSDVAQLYVHYFNEAKLRRAEREILAPLGLSRESFISRQREMDPQLIDRLSSELKNFQEADTIQIDT